QLVFTTDKTIKDLGEQVSDEDKEKAESAKEELQKALEGTDMDEIKAKKEALEEHVQNLSVKMYEKKQKKQTAEGKAKGQECDDVGDAGYEEEEEEEEENKKRLINEVKVRIRIDMASLLKG